MLFNGDCLNVLKNIETEYIDMIYLDPPFFTQTKHILSNSNGKKYEFSDIWESRKDYLNYMRIRLIEMKRILKSTGSIFLHCDTSASHYLKILLDEIFGENNFRSEIIWTYKRWSNSKKGLIPNHQIILFYSKTSNFKFNTLYCEYSPTTNVDQILQKRKRDELGKVSYKCDELGNIILSEEKKGVPMSDVWDIPFLNPRAKERVGYPTQKPIELLERIIKISTDKDDIILDPFCGSGTTLVSAKILERKFIGIDINPEAIKLSAERLENLIKTDSLLLNIGKEAYKTKTDKELLILKQFECDIVQRNKGIDALLKKYYLNAPVALKIQKDRETFEEAVKLLNIAGVKKKCSLMVLITYDIEWESKKNKIPPNFIIINTYNSQINKFFKDK